MRLNIFSRVLIISSVRKQKGKSQNGVLFYIPENKETKTRTTLCSLLREAPSRSVLEKSSSLPVTLLKKNIFIVIFKGL